MHLVDYFVKQLFCVTYAQIFPYINAFSNIYFATLPKLIEQKTSWNGNSK